MELAACAVAHNRRNAVKLGFDLLVKLFNVDTGTLEHRYDERCSPLSSRASK